jgi:hypothetical protein
MKALITVLWFALFFGCSGKRNMTLTAQQNGSDVVFEIHANDINGVLGVAIWSSDTKGELLWDMNLNYFNEPHLKYGSIPNGLMAKQIFPPDDKRPRAFLPNENLYIGIDAQYDSGLDALSHTFYFRASTDASGKITSVIPSQ